MAALALAAWLAPQREAPRAKRTKAQLVREGLGASEESTPELAPLARDRAPLTAKASASLPPHAGDSDVSGFVVDAAGGSVPFAVVTAQTLSGSELATVSADADGAFQASLPAGELELLARGDAFSSALRRVAAPARGVLLELGPSSEIVGHVVDADTRSPLAGVSVTARSEPQAALGAEPPREPPGHATTSADGEFRIAGLRGGGVYRVMLTDAAWQSAPRSVSVEVGAASAPVSIAARPAALLTARILREGEPCAAGSVRAAGARQWDAPIGADGVARFVGLRPGRYEIDVFCEQALPHHAELDLEGAVTRDFDVSAGLSVSGRVVDAKGRPLPGAQVSVRPRDGSLERPAALCSSDDRGAFTCAGLQPGEHDCSVTDPLDAAADVVPVSLDDRSAEGLVLSVGALGSVRVLLGEDEAHDPARAWLRGATGLPIRARLVAGAFLFERLPLGEYEVHVDQTRATRSAIVLSEDGQALTLELPAPPRTSITGRVVDQRGEPLGDQWVSATAADWLPHPARRSEPQALSDAEGTFALGAVSGGVYDLAVDSDLGTAHACGIAAGSADVVLRVVAPTPAARGAIGVGLE